MKRLYEEHKGKQFLRKDEVCTIVGYTDEHLLLGAETENKLDFYRRTKKSTFIEDEYKSDGWRYMYIDENEIL